MARGGEKRKAPTVSRILNVTRCRLVVVGLEVGGRWDEEGVRLIEALAYHKAETEPQLLRRSAWLSWRRRWIAALSVPAARAFAASQLELPLENVLNVGSELPSFEKP